jgi:hypothetical protein
MLKGSQTKEDAKNERLIRVSIQVISHVKGKLLQDEKVDLITVTDMFPFK